MMYTCRRIIAVLLSVAVVCSFILFSVSADDSSSPFILVYKRFNSDGTLSDTVYKAPISESFITSIGIYGIQITGFEFSPTVANGLDSVVLDFRLSGFISDGTNSWALAWPSGASLGTSDYATKIYCSYSVSGRDSTPLVYDSTVYYPSNNTAIFQLSYQTSNLNVTSQNRFSISLNTPMNIKPSGASAGRAFWPYISDIHLQIGNGLANQYYLSGINFNSSISAALFGAYTWTAITYNENTGQFDSSPQSGNWFQALLGSITSLGADMQSQVAQQEKANEAGAGDALDDAYDGVGSSFGSLSDFSDVDEVANWDFDTFSDSATEGIFSWFSQATKDDLDTVQKNRDLIIVDFYSSHIAEIEGGLP